MDKLLSLVKESYVFPYCVIEGDRATLLEVLNEFKGLKDFPTLIHGNCMYIQLISA